MRAAARAAIPALFALVVVDVRSQAACITEPIDKSERADAVRQRAINEFTDRKILYKVTKMTETAVEAQITPANLELPFDVKQVIAWAVFSLNFDGSDERQSVLFTDNRTLKSIGEFDACRGLRLN